MKKRLEEDNETKIKKDESSYIEKLKVELEKLPSMKREYQKLSSVKDSIAEKLEGLDSKNYTKEAFNKEFDDALGGLLLYLSKEEKECAETAREKVNFFYVERVSYKTLKRKYDNLNKNANFYRPWILSENYD